VILRKLITIQKKINAATSFHNKSPVIRNSNIKKNKVLHVRISLASVILTTQEAEIRRIVVRNQPGQIVHETLSQKCPSQK
jgi:hypothetical protein